MFKGMKDGMLYVSSCSRISDTFIILSSCIPFHLLGAEADLDSADNKQGVWIDYLNSAVPPSGSSFCFLVLPQQLL